MSAMQQEVTYEVRRERHIASQRRLALQLLGIAVVGGFMWRFALHEETEWLRDGMKVVGAFAPFILAFGFEELVRLHLVVKGYDEALHTTDVAVRSVPDDAAIEGWMSVIAKAAGFAIGAGVVLVIAKLL